MKTPRYIPILVAAALIAAAPAGLHADETTNVLKFSDPAKPGTIKVNLGRGELRVQGADTTEITIKTDAKAVSAKPRKDGLRVLSAATSYALKESDNVISLDAVAEWGGRGNSDFRLTVPRSTTIIVQNAWGGDIRCANLSGDIEVNSQQGSIQLDDVAGGVVVGTMNGEIRASFRELHEGKPISFTSMNGEVSVRLPETTKANVRLRTQNGTVLTDFDESVLVTKTEAATYVRGKAAFTLHKPGGKVLSVEIQEAIREATQLSATAVREALESVKEGLEAARLDADEARRQMEDARRQMERTRRDMERERSRESSRTATARAGWEAGAPGAPPTPPAPAIAAVPPAPAKPAMPTITGGKLITGTLNGGGPEISVATMNGDVILRKITDKK